MKFFFLALISLNAFSSDNLLLEFLKKNRLIKANNLSVKLSQTVVKSYLASRTWYMSASGGVNVTPSRGAFRPSEDFQVGDFDNFNFSLMKKFNWGGELSFDNRYNDYQNLDYSFVQDISYRQELGNDFFGRKFRLDVALAEIDVEKTKVMIKNANQALLQKFYLTFMSAKYNKTIAKLQREAKQRSIVRQRNIKKRYAAGLLEQADTFLADTSVVANDEQVRLARFNLSKDLDALSTDLVRTLKEGEIPYFNFSKNNLPKAMTGKIENNFNLREKKRQIDAIHTRMEKVKMNFIPQIKFHIGYKSLASKSSLKKALKNGQIFNGGELASSLVVVVPLGFKENKVARARERISMQQTHYEISNLRDELKNMEKGLKTRVKLAQDNIRAARKRRRLSAKVLKSQNDLYKKGRNTLFDVLNAEVEMIRSEIGLAGYLLSLEETIVSQAILYGKLEEHLLERI